MNILANILIATILLWHLIMAFILLHHAFKIRESTIGTIIMYIASLFASAVMIAIYKKFEPYVAEDLYRGCIYISLACLVPNLACIIKSVFTLRF